MKRIMIILSFLLVICIYRSMLTYEIYEAPHNYDIELYGYLYQFEAEAKHYGLELNDPNGLRVFKFSNLSEEHQSDPYIIGICQKWFVGSPNIWYIDQWESIEVLKPTNYDDQFKALVYHELGHCLLNLEHTDNPKDIMYYEQNIFNLQDVDAGIKKMFEDAKKAQDEENGK